jgi:glycosyltransferase involved in cell wall biosynthesis
MGKKRRRGRSRAQAPLPVAPLVSVCTPTFNRRPFLPGLIKCYLAQTYIGEKVEWIVVDDGTDKVGDVFESVPGVRYFSVDEKMPLGRKRNFMHSKCKGDVILYMDDDDFYPPTRIEHAIARLRDNPHVLCVGCSELHTYFPDRKEMWTFGPYRRNHCTAATMAFRRLLLARTCYDDDAALAEEKHFLKNYTVPVVQLDPAQTIMVIAHAHNTFDKGELLKDGPNKYARRATEGAEHFIQDDWLREFYTETVHNALIDYPAGMPSSKPDVQKQYEEIKTARQEVAERAAASKGTGVLIDEGGQRRELSADEILQTLREQGEAVEALQARVQARDDLIARLRAQLAEREGDATRSLEDAATQINSEN